MANFDTLQNRHPLTNRQKIYNNRYLCRRHLQLCQIWCKSAQWDLLCKWVKYKENYLCLFIHRPYTFFGNTSGGQTLRTNLTPDIRLLWPAKLTIKLDCETWSWFQWSNTPTVRDSVVKRAAAFCTACNRRRKMPESCSSTSATRWTRKPPSRLRLPTGIVKLSTHYLSWRSVFTDG